MGGLCCAPTQEAEPSTSTVRIPPAPRRPAIGKLLVFVNPNSGAGKSLSVFHSHVAKKLEASGIDYELVVTNGHNHARYVVESKNLNEFNGILICSGDGLVFEVLNGIFKRPDAALLLPTLAIGLVPSGSGNGLLASVFHDRKESLTPASRVLRRAIDIATSSEARAQPVNLVHVQTNNDNMLAFISVGWGIMADIDIESERWRKTLGSNRFAAGAVVRCLNLRTYKGRLSYLPYVKPTVSSKKEVFPVYGTGDDISIDSLFENGNTRATHAVIDIPDINQNVPEEWVTIEDEFIGVYAVMISHISFDGPFMPRAELDDDKIYLTYIQKKDTNGRLDMLKFLTRIEDQKHLAMKCCKTVEVSSFRLEPLDTGSYVTVDGEVVDAKVIQATVTTLRTAIIAPTTTTASS